ncbi:site-specific integrase [Roseomonas sp. GC11]|uniref:site-specific integrase n=1 Tax=Roseomonas sp. GC11 TaxID=2950546 RepID=UPI002108A09D|nr:site-specific integrase [Roseomonas sp. GC11]MCQ4159713.1 site-specific integrase [Roseomonas sp. GC11]
MTDPRPPSPMAPPPALAGRLAAADYAAQSLAAETRRAYAADWRDFSLWCHQQGQAALPAAPVLVAAYLAEIAPRYSRSALRRRLAAIGHAHRLQGAAWEPAHPALRATLRGIFRAHGTPRRPAAALTSVELRRLTAACGEGLAGLRDRALLLLGFAGALRRSELAGIRREDLRLEAEGLRLMLPRSKTDAVGEGVEIGIPRGRRPQTCPVRAVERWLAASDCHYGPVFRRVDRWGRLDAAALHPDAVRQILHRRAREAGLSVPRGERLSPHGLRAGFVTEAYLAGARDEQIMDHTRHRDLKTMRAYVRRSRLVRDSAAKLLDL